MLRKTFGILYVYLFSLLLLTNCTQFESNTTIVTKEIAVTRIVQVTATPQVIEVCHLIGCSDQLTITLDGQIEDDYIVEVQQSNDPEVAIHCFPQKGSEMTIFGNHDFLNLNRPEDLTKIQEYTTALNYCDSSQMGEAKLSFLIDGNLHEAVILCNEQISETIPLGPSGCTGQDISLIGYTPENATISIYWGDNKKTVDVRPTYETIQPNGPKCEPTCRIGQVSIQIP